jgi:hypothetical protein
LFQLICYNCQKPCVADSDLFGRIREPDSYVWDPIRIWFLIRILGYKNWHIKKVAFHSSQMETSSRPFGVKKFNA